MFNRDVLLETIWQEKREKIVRPDIYPLGININLDSRKFHWHELISALLSCLRADPERGLDWARNWGRCLVLVHPKRGFSVVFNTRMSDDELLGRFVMTSEDVDPRQMLDERHNQGIFRILLNMSNPIKLEGAIIQLERMVDEVIWCEYLRIAVGQNDQVAAYTEALNRVWDGGIRLEYATESEILNLRFTDPRWTVRVYGDILGHQTVPRVIGAVDPEHHQDSGTNPHSATQSDQPVDPSHALTALPETGTCIPMVGITLAKPMHLGHVLTLGFADLIRRSMGGVLPVFVESNDMGRRIDGLIARLCELRQTTVDIVLEELAKGEITPDEITIAYRGRLDEASATHRVRASYELSSKPILRVIEDQAIQSLRAMGLRDVEIVSERSCQQEYRRLANATDAIGAGFRVARFQRAEHKRLVIVEREGIPTASASRAAFVMRVIERCGAGTLPAYIDQDASVSEAADLLNAVHRQPLVQLEGCGVGFSMAIGSGSEGNIPTIEDLLQRESGLFVRPRLTYFLLTRNATAPAQMAMGAEPAFARTEPVGVSWYDYKDERSLWSDWNRTAADLQQFLHNIAKLRDALSQKGRSCRPGDTSTQLKRLTGWIDLATQGTSLKQVFPEPVILHLDSVFSSVRQWFYQQGIPLPAVDETVIRACISGNITIGSIAGQLSSLLPITRKLPWASDTPLSCTFVSSALERGYAGAEVERIARQYLNGQFCLIRKRCLYFDILKKSIELTPSLLLAEPPLANKVLNSIDLSMARIGLE